MDDARPNGERDQTKMLMRVDGGDEQEDTQGRVNADDHLEIFRRSARPGPPRWPEDRKRVEAKNRNSTDDAQRESEVLKAFDFCHGTSSAAPAGMCCLRSRTAPDARAERRAACRRARSRTLR